MKLRRRKQALVVPFCCAVAIATVINIYLFCSKKKMSEFFSQLLDCTKFLMVHAVKTKSNTLAIPQAYDKAWGTYRNSSCHSLLNKCDRCRWDNFHETKQLGDFCLLFLIIKLLTSPLQTRGNN